MSLRLKSNQLVFPLRSLFILVAVAACLCCFVVYVRKHGGTFTHFGRSFEDEHQVYHCIHGFVHTQEKSIVFQDSIILFLFKGRRADLPKLEVDKNTVTIGGTRYRHSFGANLLLIANEDGSIARKVYLSNSDAKELLDICELRDSAATIFERLWQIVAKE